MRVLIDADIYRYQVGSIQVPHPFVETEKVPASSEIVLNALSSLIEEVFTDSNCSDYLFTFTGSDNFRFDIAKQEPYKGNRASSEKPFHYGTVEDYIKGKYEYQTTVGNEADDLLGILQREDSENTIIASRDKDLWTVPGWHMRWSCGEYQPKVAPHWVSPYHANRFFFEQLLHGDNTDNILGCGIRKLVKWGGEMKLRRKGVGEKAAIKLISSCDNVQQMYDLVKEEYHKVFKDNPDEVMLENARLLYIGQTKDNMFNWDWLDYSIEKEVDDDQNVRSYPGGQRRESFLESEAYCESRELPGGLTSIPSFG